MKIEKTLENIKRFILKWDTDSTGQHGMEWLEAQIGNQLQHLWQEAYLQGKNERKGID